MSRRKKQSETNELTDALRESFPEGVSVVPRGEHGARVVVDPSGRVAEAVYAQVFAATWVKRQDLNLERRRIAASAEAALAIDAARGVYVGVNPEDLT